MATTGRRPAGERVAIGKAIEEALGDRRGSNQYQRKVEVQNFAQADSGQKTRELAARRLVHETSLASRLSYCRRLAKKRQKFHKSFTRQRKKAYDFS
ncbi:MAG: hypothetical protein DSZ00_08780 [Gammaproteobacteria bacterium]|nr:MAG: hypothetical protein DSZ00_08780 [Gammaproteobacteria bacterium]RTZ75566.1 MAG: hypothetical protein DSZ02_03090 [Gammaproteobacteria bacterium]RTZ77969.1 MAG: hypothetical protein DSZ01_05975 [Gammaproteobacteria bacterium]